MNKNLQSTSSLRGIFLQSFMSIGSVVGGAGVAFAVLALICDHLDRVNYLAFGAMMFFVIVGVVVLNSGLSAIVFRRFNAEQAVRQTLSNNTNFVDNLIFDNIWRYGPIYAMTGGILGILGNLAGRDNPSAFWVACLILAVLYGSTIVVMLVVSFKCYGWRRERSYQDDRKIPFRNELTDVGGFRIMRPQLLTVAEVMARHKA